MPLGPRALQGCRSRGSPNERLTGRRLHQRRTPHRHLDGLRLKTLDPSEIDLLRRLVPRPVKGTQIDGPRRLDPLSGVIRRLSLHPSVRRRLRHLAHGLFAQHQLTLRGLGQCSLDSDLFVPGRRTQPYLVPHRRSDAT